MAETYTVRIVFEDGETLIRKYTDLEKAERCIRDYSTIVEDCKHVHFVDEE